MSNILTDVEKGAIVLIHDLVEPPADGASLPAEIAGAVDTLAGHFGLDPSKLGAAEKGWLFDVLNAGIDAVSGASAGHAAAGGSSQGGEPGVAAGSVPGADAPKETVPASEPAPAAPAAESAAVGTSAEAQIGHGPADTDLPPVTEPDAGYVICPECNGFRTVIVGGVVSPCPKCKGAGQVPVGHGA